MGMQLSGSLELTGSFTTSGAIVAQTLVVQTITSSITQMTGSNIFGSSLSNIQQFTGSVSINGPGGGNSLTVSTSDDTRILITDTGNSSTLMLRSDGANTSFGTTTADSLALNTNNTQRMYISSSGNVSIGSTSTVTDSHLLNIQGSTSTYNVGIVLNKTNATAQIWGITNTGPLSFYDYTNSAERMRISNSGSVGIGTTTMSYAKLNVYNNTNDATYNSKIQAVLGPADYQDSDAIQNYGAGTSETQFLVGSTSRPAMLSLGGNINAGEAVGVINFFRSANTDTYRSRAWIWGGINSTGTANQHGGYLAFSTAADGGTNPQERMRVLSTGNIAIGANGASNLGGFGSTVVTIQSPNSTYATLELGKATASTNANLGVLSFFNGANVDICNIIGVSTDANNSGALRFNTVSAGSFGERMRVTSETGTANVCIGTTSSPQANAGRGALTVNGTSTSIVTMAVGGAEKGYMYHNGSSLIFNNSAGGTLSMSNGTGGVYLAVNATSWTANSDERLKDITGNIENAVDSLMTLRAVKHTWKADIDKVEKLALIAQDVEVVFPQVIDKGKLPSNPNEEQTDETEYLGVRYTELIPVLVKAIQELEARVKELENK